MELSFFFKSYTVALFYAVAACIITVFQQRQIIHICNTYKQPAEFISTHLPQTTSSRDETISTNLKKQNRIKMYVFIRF